MAPIKKVRGVDKQKRQDVYFTIYLMSYIWRGASQKLGVKGMKGKGVSAIWIVFAVSGSGTLHFWGPAQTFYVVFIPAHQKCRVSPGLTGMESEKVGASEKWCASSAFGLKQMNYREENAIYIVKKVVWLALYYPDAKGNISKIIITVKISWSNCL
jgi:hypothetical protein